MSEKKKKQHIEENDIVADEEAYREGSLSTTKLKEKLKKCLEEKQEYLDGWQRAQADFVNYKKKENERRSESIAYAQEDIITQLLPVLDSFDMAFYNKEVWEAVGKEWRVGVEHIYAQMLGILKENGVEQINPQGEIFNPEEHESVTQEEVTQKEEDHVIIKIIQRGYRIGKKIIRPARVVVGVFKG